MAPRPFNLPSVLLVEDDRDLQGSLADQLRDAGFNVDTADSGLEAWDRLMIARRPSLMVLDLKLPGMSGWELLQRLRNSTSLVDLPVLVVSAHLGLPPAGALGWIKKPVNPTEFVATVKRLAHA